ncbi:MAG: adenylosuccinate lyase [Spirochaetia bacterium]|jgi:adenylosuccinate lyase|nr:adenylosuccinate lyase [Spirochaetales bacterium]MDX9783514.1 adenylosuccinate lyase [Spirochaetia bacterium]
MKDYSAYLSPFSWRYGSERMRHLWSETHKRELWRRLWLSLATVQADYGLVSPEQLAELRSNAGKVNIERSHEIEAEIRHDLMAEIKAFAEQCPSAGGIIHLGATSMDIEDNADALRIRESLGLVREGLKRLLLSLAEKIETYADFPVMAFTHLQPAEPSSFGYRCSVWAQDLLMAYDDIVNVEKRIRGKGFKGAVGSSASYGELLGLERLPEFEQALEKELEIEFFPVSTQTSPRLQEYQVLAALASLAAALHKMAFDFRILQSPPIGELAEPFGSKQVGSSAMPFKRNPIDAEKIDSLARLLAVYPQVAWGNAALSLLERTLDDSANRRSSLPESFLAADELIKTAQKIVSGFRLDQDAAARTFRRYAPFACTERVMMAMAKAGADRQQTHERLREHALAAWEILRGTDENPLRQRIAGDSFFTRLLSAEKIDRLMEIEGYLGDAPRRAAEFSQHLKNKLAQ